ncbi:hypothetical protein ABIB66_008007 [Bradyrhizobium sp. F1.13.3]
MCTSASAHRLSRSFTRLMQMRLMAWITDAETSFWEMTAKMFSYVPWRGALSHEKSLGPSMAKTLLIGRVGSCQ